MVDLMSRLQAEIAAKGFRPVSTIPGLEIGVWWRLLYDGDTYQTEAYNQSSICFARVGAASLQLVSSVEATLGSGLIEVRLAPGERPVFYRIRSMDLDDPRPGSRCEAVVYGKGREGGNAWHTDLWCMVPGQPGYDRAVPQHWFDQQMVETQLTTYG